MMHINSKAAIKRIPIGTRLRLVNCLTGPCNALREVKKVQSNALGFRKLTGDERDREPWDGTMSWLYLDGEGETVESTDKGFRLVQDGKVCAEYEFVEGGAS